MLSSSKINKVKLEYLDLKKKKNTSTSMDDQTCRWCDLKC